MIRKTPAPQLDSEGRVRFPEKIMLKQ